MASIKTVVDLGCGSGQDSEWWATRTTRDGLHTPLDIKCTAVDISIKSTLTFQHDNVTYQSADFEKKMPVIPDGFDILWCHDAFQYAVNPIGTLGNWWHSTSRGGMLYICVPITQRVHRRQLEYYLPSNSYYHYSMTSLMHMLATAGWDCGSGFFQQKPLDPWLHAIVYKSDQRPRDPKTTSWHELAEANLLPKSAVSSILAHGHVQQQDLIVPWIDHSLSSMSIK
jgi:SAM-dependent methyltransferase